MAELGDTIIKGDLNVLGNISTNGTLTAASDSYTKTEVDTKMSAKQDKLTAGTNITISNNTISAKNTTYTNATSKSDGLMSKEDKSKIDNILKLVYPVGAIYISVNSTSPATLFGGTWERIARGRTLVGEGIVEDNNDNWCGKTKKGDWTAYAGNMGGEVTHTLTINEMPSHTHNLRSNYTAGGPYATPVFDFDQGHSSNDNNAVLSAGGGQAHNNLPPYLVVYIWKRTA